MKLMAPCWSRCICRYPPLANQIWMYWRRRVQNEAIIDSLPNIIPKNWRKTPELCDNIIRACPFCVSTDGNKVKIGNLENLHLYCSSNSLQKARTNCNQKLEDAIYKLYKVQRTENTTVL
jgi:hypothetical protein